MQRDVMQKIVTKVEEFVDSQVFTGYEDHVFESLSYDAGTPGTRGVQANWTPTHTPFFATVIGITDSSKFNPLAFINGVAGTNLKVYLNLYRASSDAVSNASVTVRAFYKE